MRSLLFLLPLLVVVRSEGNVCADVHKENNECQIQAHQTYVTAMKLGDDGRPDWRARKTCNYLTEAIEVCGNVLTEHGCNTEEAVTTMKDTQFGKLLKDIGRIVADFDSCKCPAAKAHIDRMKANAGLPNECPPEFAVVREEFHIPRSYWDVLDAVESTSQFIIDLEFGFIGGAIVATGVVLAKHFVLAFF